MENVWPSRCAHSVRGLRDAGQVVRTILAVFEQIGRARAFDHHAIAKLDRSLHAGHNLQMRFTRRRSAWEPESLKGVQPLTQVLAVLRNSPVRLPAQLRGDIRGT